MDGISDKIAAAVMPKLPEKALSRVSVEPTLDSDGHDAWSVTVILHNEDVTGDQALQTIVAVQETFESLGDESIAIVHFATEDDLKADVGPEA